MPENRFLQKYQNKTNAELEKIAASRYDYVLDARHAAVQILQSRDLPSPHEASIEAEIKMRDHKEVKVKIDREKQRENIIEKLNNIPVGHTRRWIFKNRNELQVKRWSSCRFQVRVEDHYHSFVAPVIICKMNKNSSLRLYPFFYLEPILWHWGVAALIVVLCIVRIIPIEWIVVAYFVLLYPIVIQLILMPLAYFLTRADFKSELGK